MTGPAGADGTTGPAGANGATGAQGAQGDAGAPGPAGFGLTSGVNIKVVSVTPATPTPTSISVRFTVKDDRGMPIDLAGNYSKNRPFAPSFSLSYISFDAAGNVLPYTVVTKTGNLTGTATTAPDKAAVVPNPTAVTPTWPIPAAGLDAKDAIYKGVMVENGSGYGDYTYTFPTGGNAAVMGTSGSSAGKMVQYVATPVLYDATKLNNTWTLWIQASRQMDLVDSTNVKTFKAVNVEYNFIPSGTGTPTRRQLVNDAQCQKCHDGFKPLISTSNGVHGGGRINANYCGVCHNTDRKTATANPDGGAPLATAPAMPAFSNVAFHRIHHGEVIKAADMFHGIAATYPQDMRNCDMCHTNALQGAQYLNRSSIDSCGSCHDAVKFDGTAASDCSKIAPALDSTGRYTDCNHFGGAMPNTIARGSQAEIDFCNSCHASTGTYPAAKFHVSVAAPDPGAWSPANTTGNSRTNAAWLAAAGEVPAGALKVSYDLKSVSTYVDSSGDLPVDRPQMVFRLLVSDGGTATPVIFPTADGGTNELAGNFVGAPSIYWVWSMPQDGITAPADFNTSASCYLRDAINGRNVKTGGAVFCSISTPDNNGYYTVKALGTFVTDGGTSTGFQVADGGTMLTGGLGYSYDLKATRPLTQIDVPGYTYAPDTTDPVNAGAGGLIVPAANVAKAATGFTARRPIIDNAKCQNCHVQLGANPSFHVGQRNDGPTCSFCHTPNQTSSGWSAGSKVFIHGIHASNVRNVPFNWHATATTGFTDVGFPSPTNYCEACHLPGTYDFTLAASKAAVGNMQPYTVATGTQTAAGPTNYSLSPYVDQTGTTVYGSGYSYSSASGVITPAAATTLVTSPVTAACTSCHDSKPAIAHMENMGGAFYKARSFNANQVEQCLICHGPGKVSDVTDVHAQ